MFIQTEQTPNPDSLKFIPGSILLDTPMDFPNRETAKISPLALRLFAIPGVEGVFVGRDFVTISKQEDLDWYALKPAILGALMEHLMANKPILREELPLETPSLPEGAEEDKEIIAKIQEIIETRVRPSVALDGGDIVFVKFEEGIVSLKMKGACSGCPSSQVTLKSGIENMLRFYVPGVIAVEQI